MTATVAHADPERRFEWVGIVGFRMFEERHLPGLEPLERDRTRLHNREELSGASRPSSSPTPSATTRR